MARTTLTVTTFNFPNGQPVANGSVTMRLNQIGSVNDTQIGFNFTSILLNSEGELTGSPTFWPNSQISPTGTYYIQSVFTATGQQVAGPNVVTV